MAHGFESDDTMVSYAVKPWHDFAKVTQDVLTKDNLLQEGGIDWTVEKRPLFFRNDSNEMIEALDAHSIVRLSDMKSLGVVGEGYNPVQNQEILDFAEALRQEGGTYETAGSLFGGKRIFICAKLRTIDILDDATDEYLVLTSSHDGTSPFISMTSVIRVVCANTLRMAMDQATRMVKLRHTKNVADRVESARQVLSLAHKYTDKIATEAKRLVTIPFSGKLLEDFTDKVFGFNEETSTRMKNMQESNRETFQMALMAPDLANFKGTAWGTFQALSDLDSHRPVPRDNQISKDRNFMRLVEGDNWLENNTKLMLEMADAE